jgi:hypothetical protein
MRGGTGYILFFYPICMIREVYFCKLHEFVGKGGWGYNDLFEGQTKNKNWTTSKGDYSCSCVEFKSYRDNIIYVNSTPTYLIKYVRLIHYNPLISTSTIIR